MIDIISAAKKYTVQIVDDNTYISEIVKVDNSFFVIDRNVYQLYGDRLFGNINEDRLFLLDAIEEKKVIETALEICSMMTNLESKRNSILVSIGGGITQDITGFVANILYRGIKWVFIPTTLLASCDSCIGGKTSLNYKTYKNLLGTFYAPDEIYIFPSFFDTLLEKDYLSGLGEVLKFNIMSGKSDIDKIEDDLDLLIKRDKHTLKTYVIKSLEYKKAFIETDEFDKNERIKLNFAHTFGHAFETTSKYLIPHGTAVAMGMIVANRISEHRGWLTMEDTIRMEKILKKVIKIDCSLVTEDMKNYIQAIKKDKKQIDSSITGVLLHDDMSLEIVHDVTVEEIECAVKHIREIL